jgi:hypothetical protein
MVKLKKIKQLVETMMSLMYGILKKPVMGVLFSVGSSYSDASGEKTESSRGASDYWVIKLDKFEIFSGIKLQVVTVTITY